MFDVSDMYTTADAWGWTWEREIKNKMPRKWSQEWEVELAINIMHKVFFKLYNHSRFCKVMDSDSSILQSPSN